MGFLTSDRARRDGRVTVVQLLTSIAGFVAFSVMGGILIAGLLLPAVQQAREAARRLQCTSNLKQLGLALMMHQDAKGSYPAAGAATATGPSRLSWRVHILPFLEQQTLYEQFKLDEPWAVRQWNICVQDTQTLPPPVRLLLKHLTAGS